MSPHRIVTEFVYPPIPIRTCDWQATYDNDEPDDEGRMVVGHGETEIEAVLDLIENHPRPGVWCCEHKGRRTPMPPINPHDIFPF